MKRVRYRSSDPIKFTDCTATIRLAALCLCLTLAGCGRTYWYNPDPIANFERDHLLSLSEGQRVQTSSLDSVLYQEDMFNASMYGQRDFGAGLGRGMQAQMGLEERKRRAQERAYYEAMQRRGWMQVDEKKAIALGIVKPENR